MSAAALTPLLWLLSGGAWVSAVILWRAARRPPRIGALTERSVIACILAVLGTEASILRYNTDTGFSLFPMEVATLLFALTMLVVLLIPTVWLVLWVSGNLGQDGSVL